MSVSKVDVRFLRSIVRKLDSQRLSYYRPAKNRNAYAMIFRFKGVDGVRVSRLFSPHDINELTAHDVLHKLDIEATDDAPSSLSLFFLRQKDSEEHRWSSAVTFPGGKRDDSDDRDDIDCVRRHAYSQLGIPLKGQFILLGRMKDAWNYSRDLGGGAMSARFVFLHIGDMTPTLKLANYLVASTAWVPIALLEPSNVRRDRIKHPFYAYLRGGSRLHMDIKDNFSNSMMYFPSVPLPGELGHHFGDVWGSTLNWTSTLLVWSGRRRLDWPLVSTTTFFLQYFIIYPVHGALQLSGHELAEGIPTQPLHVGCLMMVASILSVMVSWVLYAVGVWLYVVFDASMMGPTMARLSKESKKIEEMAATQRDYNFFNIPWKLIYPPTLDPKMGPMTEQVHQEIKETKEMLQKLTEQVKDAPRPEGGEVVTWGAINNSGNDSDSNNNINLQQQEETVKDKLMMISPEGKGERKGMVSFSSSSSSSSLDENNNKTTEEVASTNNSSNKQHEEETLLVTGHNNNDNKNENKKIDAQQEEYERQVQILLKMREQLKKQQSEEAEYEKKIQENIDFSVEGLIDDEMKKHDMIREQQQQFFLMQQQLQQEQEEEENINKKERKIHSKSIAKRDGIFGGALPYISSLTAGSHSIRNWAAEVEKQKQDLINKESSSSVSQQKEEGRE